ncbi:small multi-drug export protein [Alteribacter natronophilus]|uniref:small multi-drug export protein n=1 Tax=Alteribacter natronophilus TaxID=2583810 RepID=UPI00110E587D|nr:small multi-drug export protein [Alteribacter natronophilus]TMW70635.1 small multi-drug export protein [Alteribacter natronophilus]
MFELLWQYTMIFIMAALPWLEILVVIPIGIGIGLNPFGVGLVSFLGNFLPVLLIVYLMKWFQSTSWYIRRREKRKRKKEAEEEAAVTEKEQRRLAKKQHRRERAGRIFEKYGLPGLAFLGPAVTGIHLAAVIALSLNSGKTATTVWMGVSLLAWTILLTVVSYYGFDFIL